MSFFGRFSVGVLLGCVTIAVSGIGWTFQQPTYLIEKDASGVTSYTCDTSEDTCKVNFDFTPSLPTEEPATHYLCLIDFGFGTTGEENKCNPNTVEFPIGTWNVHVIVKKIADDSIVTEGSLIVFRPDDTIDPTHVTHALEWQTPTYLLGMIDTTLAEYSCDPAKSECKINPKIIPLLDAVASTKITCLISADFTLVPTSDPCNPNTSTVPVGEHSVTIQLLQKKDNAVLQTRTIVIKNIPSEETLDPTRVTMTKTWQSPTSLLGISDASLSEYSCDPTKEECKINPLFSPLLDGLESPQLTCEVTADFEIILTSDPCNPNTSIVPIGEHSVTVKILEKSSSTLLQTYTIVLKNIPPEIEIFDPTRVSMGIVFQQPTYLLEKEDMTLSEYSCDPSKPECKINLQLFPKLDAVESSLFDCHITSDFGLDILDCNPDTFIVPIGEYSLTLELIQKNSGTIALTRDITLHSPEKIYSGGGSSSSSSSLSSSSSTPNVSDLSNVQIRVQSGLDANSTCRTEACQVNFEAIVPSGTTCHWDFSGGVFETPNTDTKCNPGFVRFSADAMVTLTVSDSLGNTVARTYPVYRSVNPTVPPESILPKITLQGKISKNKMLTDTGIICALGKAKTCSLNFTAEDSVGADKYFWEFGDGEFSTEKNPGAHPYPLGNYQVRLRVSNGQESPSIYFDIQVVEKLEAEEDPFICLGECPDLSGKIHISAALPNPPHADTVEWIEIKNLTQQSLPLTGCTISDDSRSYDLSGTIGAAKTLRLRQIMTGISLGNSNEDLTLECNGQTIDFFSWHFAIPSGYILRREMLQNTPKKGAVIAVIDGDTLDMMLDGKKTRIRLLGVDTPETVHPRKPVEKFGKQASDFTKKTLEGKTVWITFDHEPIDHYGRTLGYIWQCSGHFSEENCELFNAQLVTEGYARMERRFEFIRYDIFDDLEKEAKKQKVGIWGDSEVAKVMNETGKTETELLTAEQEKAFLELQAELLELEVPVCEENIEDETCEEIKVPEWREVTEQLTAFNASAKKTGIVTFSGRTWADFPLSIEIRQDGSLIRTFDLRSNELGEFKTDWYPEKTGEYTAQLVLKKGEELDEKNSEETFSVLSEIIENGNPTSPKEPTPILQPDILSIQKTLIVGSVSDHFLNPLTAKIVVQGAMTDNRWLDGDIFHCRSRGSCSVNLVAEVNRSDAVTYEWILPEAEKFAEKNPRSIKVGYGQHSIQLEIEDTITGEKIVQTLTIDHRAIPKKASTKKTASSKFTLDLKDVPKDRGGGVSADGPENPFLFSLLTLLFLGGVSLLFLRQKST